MRKILAGSFLKQIKTLLSNFSLSRKKVIALSYIGAIAVAGSVLLFISRAASFSISLESENGYRTAGSVYSDSSASGGSAFMFGGGFTTGSLCGKRVTPYNYQVPFGNAVWNQPVCNLPRYSKSSDFATRLVKWSGGGQAGSEGIMMVTPGYPVPTQLDPLAGVFSREVYLASNATTEAQVTSVEYESNLDGTAYNDNVQFPAVGKRSHHPNNKIPWNPNWKTGKGGDNEIFILDDRPGSTMGRIYTISIFEAGACFGDSIFWPNRVCGSSIQVSRDIVGNYIDYRTYEGFVSDRGVGLSYYATLVTPEEVEAGEIRHAIGIGVPNTSFGPACTKQQLGTSAENTTCGTAFAPASKFEWAGVTKATNTRSEPFKSYSNDKNIPEGTRFAMDITDAQLEDLIKSNWTLKDNPTRANTFRIIAKAMRDYGMIVVDTSGGQASIQMVGGVNPISAQKWKNLGLGPEWSPQHLLQGLLKQDNVYVVELPVLTCQDGSTSKYFCNWTNAKY